MIQFTGKTANISDLCGEKLNESWVQQVLGEHLARPTVKHKFAMLAPEMGSPPYYVFFLEAADLDDDQFKVMVKEVEVELCQNSQYAYCRQLGQLGSLRGFRIQANGARDFLRCCEELGQLPGAIKATALHRKPGWCQRLEGVLM